MYRCGYNNNKSGGIHNSYSTGDQGFMDVSKSSVYALELSLFTAIIMSLTLCYNYNIHPMLAPNIYPYFGTRTFFILSNCMNYYGSKPEIHYHNHLIPMLPYKETVKFDDYWDGLVPG